MKSIFIARHGQTDWNTVPKVQGATDIPLNQRGIEQAHELADFIKNQNYHFDMILCSPLLRALETARIVAETNNIPLKIEPRLIEQNFGKWEGWETKKDNTFHLAKQQFVDSYEDGESMMKVAQRIYNLLDELKEKQTDEKYLLVSHNGIARVVESYFFTMSNDNFASFSLKNCQIKEYSFC